MSPMRKTETATGGRLRAAAVAVLLAGATLLAARALAELLRDRFALRLLWGGVGWLAAGLLLATALAAAAALLAARAAATRAPGPGLWTFRAALYLAVLGAVASVLWLQPYRRLVAELLLGGLSGLLAALVLAAGTLGRVPRRPRAVLDIVLLNACVLSVGGELGLRAWAAHSTSPLFAPAEAGAAAMIERWKLPPGSKGAGYLANSHGFQDDEFRPGAPGAPVVASIGDSFSVGIVPNWFHFSSVAERDLPGVPIHSLGVAAVGPREYERLLLTEALPLQPAVVVVGLFVGNDLTAPLDEPESGDADALRSWMDRDRLLLLRVPRFLAGGDPGPQAVPSGAGGEHTPEDLERIYPWLADAAQEVPGMSEPQYVRLEAYRARGGCGQIPPPWPELFATLRRMHEACEKQGAVFALMLIPDEFQIEDALWAAVEVEATGENLDRDAPQRVLGAFCKAEGVPCLDLLSRLRAVPPLGDGDRHLYSVRDTHWNRRGNEEAGHALAEFLRPILEFAGR